MNQHTGRQRVIISDISPFIEQGQFPAKAALGEPVIISASIFCDSHDIIDALVLMKHQDDQEWKEIRMKFVINDHWEAVIQPERTGFYEFKLQAWVDHFGTWQYGLRKKFDAQHDIEVELQIGADLLERASRRANDENRLFLLESARQLLHAENPDSAVLLAVSDKLTQTVYAYRDEELVTTSAGTGFIEIERKKAAFSTWYELFPRSAAEEPDKHGTFKDVQRLLPRIANMGFDVLYFPPIHPIGEKNRKGKNNSLTPAPDDPGSPWAIGNKKGGHKAIHPQLGKLSDFRKLVKEAKTMGIDIAMDIAYQCAPDHPYVKEHPQWFKWRPDGSVQYAENPPKKYEDILPINFETEDWENLWQELKSVIDYWIKQGVNIFRIDNPHTKSFHFWQWMIGEVRKTNPDVIFLAEAFTRPRLMERLAKGGFNQSYTYFTWRNNKKEIEEYLTQLTKTEMRYYFRPNFWPNTPDILPPELNYDRENGHIMRVILAATLSSNYGIYGPVYEYNVNTPHPGKEEYTDNEKYEIKHWDWNHYTRTKEIVSRVNRIRKKHPALQSTWNLEFAETNNEQIICYGKADPSKTDQLLVAVNLDVHHIQGAYVKVPLEHLGLAPNATYQVHDLLSGHTYDWHGEWNYVELNPHQMPAHIFRIQPNKL